MIEYSTKLLIDSIGYMLRKEFGNDYTYEKNIVPQKLKRPMFFVRRIVNINTKQLSSVNVFRENNVTTVVVRFFPEEKEQIPNVTDLWDVEDRLLKLFRYIELTLDGEKVEGGIVVNSITTEEVDGTLQLTMDLRIGTIEFTDSQKIRYMKLYQNIKEE